MSVFSFKSYALLTSISVIAAVYNSFSSHNQFFPTVLHLTTNKVNRTILINFYLMIIVKLLVSFINFTFGELREIERLNVIERAKRKILDIALMLLIFREDLEIQFIILMIQLISLSFVHWIAIKRSEFLIAETQLQMKLHLKLILCFFCICITDYYVCNYYYKICFIEGSFFQVQEKAKFFDMIFAFEFLSLTLKMILPFFKYCINLFEIFTLSHYQSKLTIFALFDFIFTLAKLSLQLYLINYIRMTYGLPLFLIGDAIEYIIGIFRAFKVFIKSIYLVFMINRLEDVNQKEIQESENICLICLDEIKQGKRLSCGHLFHSSCLRTWIQGNPNQFCPKCKAPIQSKPSQIKPQQDLKEQNFMQDLTQMKNQINLYQSLQSMRQSSNNSNEEQAVKSVGSVAYGLPCDGNYINTLSNEIKRLQIKIMNLIMVAIEQGEIETSFKELLNICELIKDIQISKNQVNQENQQTIPPQQEEEKKETVYHSELQDMIHQAAMRRFQDIDIDLENDLIQNN